MAQTTEYVKLVKPEMEDEIRSTIPALADNFNKIDDEFHSRGYNILWNALLVKDGDWTPAIQTAIDHVASLGGGTVFIPEGIWQIKSKIVLKENVTLAGKSFKSVLRLADNTEIDWMIETELILDRYVYNIEIRDLCLDGNRLNGAKSGGIIAYNTWQGRFERLKIVDIGGTAFMSYGKGHGASTNWLRDSIITYNDGYGVVVDAERDENDNLIALNGDFHIYNCDIGVNGYTGIVFYPSACTIRDSVVWMNGQKLVDFEAGGIKTMKTATHVEITNCNVEGNKQNGIDIFGSHNMISGCRVFANSQQSDWDYYGIAIHDTAKGTDISGTKVLSGVGIKGQQRSIYNAGKFTNIRNNDLVFMDNGNFKLDIDPVEYTSEAFTTMNYDYNHILTDLEYTLNSSIKTNAGTVQTLKFNKRVVDSFVEYNAETGKFKPMFTGYYRILVNLFMIPDVENTDVQIFVDDKPVYKDYLSLGKIVTLEIPPVYVTKDKTIDVKIYTSEPVTIDQISTIKIYKAEK